MKRMKKPVCPECGITTFKTNRLLTEKGYVIQYRCALCTKLLYTVPEKLKEVYRNGKLESGYESSDKVSSRKNVQ